MTPNEFHFYLIIFYFIHSRVFGFVARKQGYTTDNSCHIFAELESEEPADAIVNFIMKIMLGLSVGHKR